MANSDLYFTCEICIEPVNINKKFKHNNGNCKDNFCTDCICKYVEANMVQSNNANIKCPVLGCRLPLNPLSCRPILPTHLFDKWCELLCGQTVLQKYELSQRCYCPYPDCSALVLNECGDNPTESTCPNCKRQICFQCKSPWHPGALVVDMLCNESVAAQLSDADVVIDFAMYAEPENRLVAISTSTMKEVSC
ncbi:Zinc finger, C6HC-type [Corchorus olitorius]|uniref:RBR-type E3 ubiquitin transferase n=1 Tax=Corchorus olitorius TaxID=93759 RepID=A0A1R3HCH5_9ROSI|nr:Zinc finger, C6HC-type [Corchorus olitorius]